MGSSFFFRVELISYYEIIKRRYVTMKLNKDLTKGILIGASGMGLVSSILMTAQKRATNKSNIKAYDRGVRDGMDGRAKIENMNQQLDQLTKALKEYER